MSMITEFNANLERARRRSRLLFWAVLLLSVPCLFIAIRLPLTGTFPADFLLVMVPWAAMFFLSGKRMMNSRCPHCSMPFYWVPGEPGKGNGLARACVHCGFDPRRAATEARS